ncbi:MAG: hypothetical protein IKN72_03825 [Clostridia bacterium]|nr:hypothetical protein [Clostridia bacterium]
MAKYTFECERCGKIATASCVPHVELTLECAKDYFSGLVFHGDLCPECLQAFKRFIRETIRQEAVL